MLKEFCVKFYTFVQNSYSMKKIKFAAIMAALASLFTPASTAAASDTNPSEVQHPDWLKNAVIYEVNLRQGTPERTLKGFQKQLPRLKDLGVDVLWLMPIHPISEVNRKGELGSYYAVADYKAVNPEFGTLDDLKELVAEAHRNGMKVIIDEVCNHSGCDNAWVKEHPDFYVRNEKGEMYGPFDWTDTYKLDYTNPALRAAMLDALKFWIQEADIDGYRFDVAMEVPTDFWEQARAELQPLKEVFFLAEASKPELTQKAFDADYNWPMKDLFNAIAATKGVNKYAQEHGLELKQKSAPDIDSLLARQKNEYPEGALNMLMITNHDLNSWEGTEFERLGPATGAFAVLTYTLPGIPMMYTGQEVGFNHPFKFFEQDITPDYTSNEFTAFYEMLNGLRHSNKALWSDSEAAPMVRYATANPDVYAFERQRDGNRVLVIVNLSSLPSDVKFTNQTPDLTGMKNYFTGIAEHELPSKLQPWEYKVFVK